MRLYAFCTRIPHMTMRLFAFCTRIPHMTTSSSICACKCKLFTDEGSRRSKFLFQCLTSVTNMYRYECFLFFNNQSVI